MHKPIAVLAFLALSAACTDQATAPQPQASPTLASSFMNNPDNGNPRIWRGSNDEYGLSWTDPSNGLRASHWTFHAVEGCGETPDGGSIDFQEVVREDFDDFFASRLILNAMGKVWIRIRDLNTPGDCFGAKFVASGWGTLHLNDNDEISGYPGNPRHNANAWSFRAQGTLTTPDGRKVQYSGYMHYTWLGLDAGYGNFQVENFKVSVH